MSPSAPRPQPQIALGRATLPPLSTRVYPDPDQPGRGSGGVSGQGPGHWQCGQQESCCTRGDLKSFPSGRFVSFVPLSAAAALGGRPAL